MKKTTERVMEQSLQNKTPDQTALFLRACSGARTERTPVWLMRQAGRYLPEYRAVREKVDFATLCRTPELAAEVTLQPLQRFGFDACIIFADIMTPLASMGVEVRFAPGPQVDQPLTTSAAVAQLRVPEQEEIAPWVAQAVRLVRRHLAGRVPVIGFAGAPLTLAAYLVEGRGSKDFLNWRRFVHAEPQATHLLLMRLAEAMARYLCAQIAAGAEAVQLFDTWAGLFDERLYRRFGLPAVQHIFREVAAYRQVPMIYFAPQSAAFLPTLAETGATVLGLDWRVDLAAVRAALTARAAPGAPDGACPRAWQGNLDPAVLYAPRAALVAEVQRILAAGGAHGHIFNLGHGVQPDTPVESVAALVETVHAFQAGV